VSLEFIEHFVMPSQRTIGFNEGHESGRADRAIGFAMAIGDQAVMEYVRKESDAGGLQHGQFLLDDGGTPRVIQMAPARR
jgi:hypothetical protein